MMHPPFIVLALASLLFAGLRGRLVPADTQLAPLFDLQWEVVGLGVRAVAQMCRPLSTVGSGPEVCFLLRRGIWEMRRAKCLLAPSDGVRCGLVV